MLSPSSLMLRNYIEIRERSLHGRDNNRASLPFEWGLEHVGISQERAGDPDSALGGYVSRALANSEAFYAFNGAGAFEFDGHLLKFPSPVETPYAVNNVACGRFFDGGKNLAVIVLPQWNCKWDGQVGLCRALQRWGISSLRLSLPYHHQRKPADIERAEYLVSSNVGRTLTAIRQAVADARRAADWLFEQGHERVALLGTSIGSCIAFLAFAHDSRFSSGAFVHVSSYFADVVWSGLSTTHVRQALDGYVSLDRLRALWEPISPFPFMHKLQKVPRPMLMISGEYDMTFLPDLTRQVYAEFDRRKIPAEVLWFPCGHYTMGKLPFSAMAGFRILRFFLEQRDRLLSA
jgi:hypothetical protein